ncbi:MAG: metallophosphoesterase [Bacteroidia bacterium]|nr:metallophosphoesterase [Bacteroidia bacterium]
MKKVYTLIGILQILLISSCATHRVQYAENTNKSVFNSTGKQLEKTIYLIGDAGAAVMGESTDALKAFKDFVAERNTKGDYTIFLGDNIYEDGMPSAKSENRAEAMHRMDVQIKAVEGFDGEVLFIPGNHDWYDEGPKSVKRQEQYVEKALGKNTFQPEDGCPIETIDVSEDVVIIAIDTQWYLTNWDRYPTMNDECELKTRSEFIDELEGELKKNNEKTIILAMHHPAYTYGPHNGGFSAEKHLFPFQTKIPLPGIATLIAQVRSQGGVSVQDRYNMRYDELMDRLITLVRGNDRVIITSGHEHSLQYNEDDGIKQIVSGSGSKNSAVRMGKHAKFTYGDQGFAVLKIYKDRSSEVTYYSAVDGKAQQLFNTGIYEATVEYDTSGLADAFESSVAASTYAKEATLKGKSYEWFWGQHYRYVYGKDIQVPVATLDTLYGGLTIDRKGGGHQTRSLRLVDRKKRNFAMRGVKKSATRYLQSVLFTNTYVEKDFEDTVTEDLVLDFYTASHPFASFVVAPLADAIGVYHTNPLLVYVPKHKALGNYNDEFGDELYIIEERPDDGFLNVESFGKPSAIESTSDLRKKLRKDEKYQVDEPAFIRARLFDMLLGDWDRHQDQWRWSRFDITEDKKIFRPIPRDRDQVFSNYDGALLDILRLLVPAAGQLQTFEDKIDDIKWLNSAGIKIDRSFIQTSERSEWIKQADYIVNNLTDEVIENAFLKLPPEVQDETAEEIKRKLKSRRDNLRDAATRYYEYISRLVIITGTDKDDYFEITRGNGSTKITVSRIKDGKVAEPYKERIINSNETNEVWIYGLDDDDQFVVNGKGSNPVFIRIIGGQNNDVYTIENGRKIKVHEHNNKPNTIVKKSGASVRRSDFYEINTYDYEKLISRSNNILPSIGANPDDGLRIGITDIYTIRGFKTNPFHQKHSIGARYFFATEGFDLAYNGEFAGVFGTWNLTVGGRFTSENFTRNFFGFGNNTVNMDDEIDFDYNRVKTAIRSGRVGVVKHGEYGGSFSLTAGVENIEVEETEDRFVSEFFMNMPTVFDSKTFARVDVSYQFESYDNAANPARGMFFALEGGVNSNTDDTERTFGYVNPRLIFFNSLTRDQKLVLKTMAQGQFNIGDDFEFYQAAVLGADTGLRGYRTQRFSGESALAFGGDLRYSFSRFKTGILPIQLGVFGGYDVGRVWVEGEDSDIWHDDFGGGIFLNAVDSLFGELGIFNSDDGIRISFGFGVSL